MHIIGSCTVVYAVLQKVWHCQCFVLLCLRFLSHTKPSHIMVDLSQGREIECNKCNKGVMKKIS